MRRTQFSSSRTLPGKAQCDSRSSALPEKVLSKPFSLAELFQEPPRQQLDVAGALAQRRDQQGDHIDAVIEVGAEIAARHRLFEVAVGGADDAHVNFQGLRAADALELAFLQHAQQLGLERGGDFADFVQKQRAAVGEFEAAGALATAPVNEPFSWPNSSDSITLSGSAAQLTLTKAPFTRGEFS